MADKEQYELQDQAANTFASSYTRSSLDLSTTAIQPLIGGSVAIESQPERKSRKTVLSIVAICVMVITTIVGTVIGTIAKHSILNGTEDPYLKNYTSRPERAEAVREAFDRAWTGYYELAFPNDSLKPTSKESKTDRSVHLVN